MGNEKDLAIGSTTLVHTLEDARFFFENESPGSLRCHKTTNGATVEKEIVNLYEAEEFFKDPSTHPAVFHMLQFFEYAHLPQELQDISRPFCDLAKEVIAHYPSNPETINALRKLLEAKDCAVRANISRGVKYGESKI